MTINRLNRNFCKHIYIYLSKGSWMNIQGMEYSKPPDQNLNVQALLLLISDGTIDCFSKCFTKEGSQKSTTSRYSKIQSLWKY